LRRVELVLVLASTWAIYSSFPRAGDSFGLFSSAATASVVQ
jgi:hypothetical protein